MNRNAKIIMSGTNYLKFYGSNENGLMLKQAKNTLCHSLGELRLTIYDKQGWRIRILRMREHPRTH